MPEPIDGQHMHDVLEQLRVELWEACPHVGKYGDDGQLQCGGLDFTTADLAQLVAHVDAAKRAA